MKQRILSFLLCLALILPTFALLSAAAEVEEAPTPMEAFCEEWITGKVLSDDGTIGIPVELNTYVKDGDASITTTDTASIFYVIGTNTERVGTDSDEAIIRDLLDEGYLVTVVDYREHPLAVSPSLDWSLQKLRLDAVENGTYLGGAKHHAKQNYILPAGYRIVRGLEYFDIAAETNEGVLDWIVKIWNEDFTDRCGDMETVDKNGNACKVSDIKAETIDDCRNKDGSALDLKLRMDFIYPSNPDHEVPVMCLSSSSEDRNGNWMVNIRPHMTGFLFAGYAGVTWDHVYVPMARYDHYGYFEDTQNYDAHTLQRLIGVKAQTAAVRFVRYMANKEHDTYRFDLDRFGAFGMSKGGYVYLLGNKHPEAFAELWDLAGDVDATNGPQRWLTYEGGEHDGETIPANVQMVYAAVGNGEEWCSDGFAPTFSSQGEDDGDVSVLSFMERLRSNSRRLDTPYLGFTMPDVGHTLIYGYSQKYRVDMYKALFDFANYYLQDANAVCEYILPLDGTEEVATSDKIEIKFTGPVSRTEIEGKVRVIDTVSGTDVSGAWECELGRTSWTFTPYDMRGGVEHIVYVPADLLAENGKPLAAAKAIRFTTVGESFVGASACFSTSGDMTLTKSEEGASGVYIVLPAKDLSDSTSESLRFFVENDAYNRVAVYAVTDYNEADPASSVRGQKLGTVKIGGRGEYRLDVGEYLDTLPEGTRPVFYLEEEKTVGESVVRTEDFTKDYPFRLTTWTSMSSEENHTEGGGKSAKTTYFSESLILFPYGLSEEDFGRRFRITLWIKPTADRPVFVRIRTTAHAQSTYMDPLDSTFTPLYDLTVGEWNKVTLDYRINDPDYVKAGIQKVGLYITKSGAGLKEDRQTIDSATETVDTEWMYVDDITLTEIATEVKISPSLGSEGGAAGLITHPSTKNTTAASGSFGIGNGESADTTSDTLIVSGRAESEKSATYKKVYAKLSLDGYDTEAQAAVTLRVKNAKFGNLLVYGVSDVFEAANWSADSMSWYSAPANDRSGARVDTEKVYGGAPIATLAVLGEGIYTVNVTDYARAIRAAGGSVGTLIIVSDTEPGGTVITDEDFNDYVVDFDISRAGDAKEALISAAENYPDGQGYSYKFLSTKYYDRVKFDVARFKDMTRADIGRRFRVTYQLKADKTGSFTNIIVNGKGEPYGDMQLERKTYETAGVWQEYSYEFEATDKLVFADTTGTVDASYFGICFDKMGVRAEGGEENVTAYIDNIRVVELSSADISFEFTAGKALTSLGYRMASDKTSFDASYSEDFDSLTSGVAYSGTANPVFTYIGGTKGTVYNWAGYTGTTGKNGVYHPHSATSDGAGAVLRFRTPTPAFGDAPSDADLGRRFRFTVWLRSYAATSRAFDFGVADAEGNFIGKVTSFTATDTTWHAYTFEYTVTAEMIAKGSMTPAIRLGAAVTESDAAYNVDDVSLTELDGLYPHGVLTENFASGTTAVKDATSDGPLAMPSVGGYKVGGLSIRTDTWTIHTADDGTGGVYTIGLAADSALLFYNLIKPYAGATLSEADVGRRIFVSFWLRGHSQTGTFDITVTNVSNIWKDYAPVKTVNIDAVKVWQRYEYSFTVTEEMVRDGAALLCLRMNGYADYDTATDTSIDEITVLSLSPAADSYTTVRTEDFSRFAPEGGASASVGAAWPSENVDDALNDAYGVVWAGTGTQSVNYLVGSNNAWADHTRYLGGTVRAGLQFWGELTSSQIKFYNMISPVEGNALTEADVGRSFRFSFRFRGEQSGSFRLAVTSKSQGANTFTVKSEPYTYTYDANDPWREYAYEFTITEEMVNNSAALPTLFLDEGWSRETKCHIYIDDLTCYELTRDAKDALYRYSEDFESATAADWTNANGPLHPTRALTYGGFEAATGAGASLVSEEDGNKAVRIHSNKVYNRVMLYNVVSPLYRTENTGTQNSALSSDDLGRQFLVTFRLKAAIAGSFDVSLTAYATGDKSYTEKTTLSYTQAGSYQTFSYLVTVNRAMIEKNAGLLTLTFSGFGQNANGSQFADIYLDDITSTEFSARTAYRPSVTEATAVSNGKTDGTLSVDRTAAGEETLFGIRKVYLAFADLTGAHANRAELVLRITEAEGQILKIYGLPKALSDSVTWNNAPANRYDEGVDLSHVFGGKPIATAVAMTGELRLDVTEYVRAAGGFASFAVVSEDAGGKEYLHADFSSVELFADVDYTTDGTLTLDGGVGRVSGESITFRNAFGGRDAVVQEGREYTITVKVSADAARTFTLSVDGTDVRVSETTADGTLTLRYTASAADVARGVTSLTISADAADFTVDELVVADTSLVAIESAALTVYREKSPTLAAEDFAAKSNITLSSDFKYNMYFRIAPNLTVTAGGVTEDLTSPEIVTIDGIAYLKVCRAIAPKNGTDKIGAEITFAAAEGERRSTYTLSIPKYAKKIVNNAAYDATTQTLMKDILSYISSAMTYFGTSTDEKQNTITDIIGENYNSGLTAEAVGLTEENNIASDPGNALSALCLNLDATPAFVFYLKEGKESLADSFKFRSASGAPLAVTVKKEAGKDGRTYLEVTTYAYAMGDKLTFTYTDENGAEQEGTYYLAAYYYGIHPEEAGITEEQKAKREELQTLTLRLAKYAQSATAYRNSVINKTESK